jgi:hypothetical protein
MKGLGAAVVPSPRLRSGLRRASPGLGSQCLRGACPEERSGQMGSGRQEPLRASATLCEGRLRENDKQEIQSNQNRHYDMQDSIVVMQ